MRDVDLEPIRAALAARSEHAARDTQQFKRVEHWRDRLIAEGAPALDELMQWRTGMDRTEWLGRIAAATAERERTGASGAAACRELFRALRGPARPRYNRTTMKPLVGIIMGSQSDWETLRAAAETLDELAVPHEVRVVSAHRTPDLLFEYASTARERGLEVIIAGAGGAAHLPGMTAAKTIAARARRAGAVEGAQRPRFAAVHRADAGRRSGGDVRHRRGRRDQCGAVRRGHPRQQASGDRRRTRRLPRAADRRTCSRIPIPAAPRRRT